MIDMDPLCRIPKWRKTFPQTDVVSSRAAMQSHDGRAFDCPGCIDDKPRTFDIKVQFDSVDSGFHAEPRI